MTSVRSLVQIVNDQLRRRLQDGDKVEQSDGQPENVARRPKLSRTENYDDHYNVEGDAETGTDDAIDPLDENQAESG